MTEVLYFEYQQDERSMPENGDKVSAQTSLFLAAIICCSGVLPPYFSQSVFNWIIK
jgi:hypothetical protein